MIEKKEISFLWTFAFLLMLLISSYGLFSKPSGDFSIGLSDKILHFLIDDSQQHLGMGQK